MVNQATQQVEQTNDKTTGLWWKVPLGLAAVAAVGYGVYRALTTGNVEEVVTTVAETAQ